MDCGPITDFGQWYTERREHPEGGFYGFQTSKEASRILQMFREYRSEMDQRTASFYKLEQQADGEVVTKRTDLPNVSSGETAGIVRRIARNLVQHVPNVEIISKYDDDSREGVFARHILLSKIIGSDEYSNDMQQNLFASTKTSLTVGFDCVVPLLQQRPSKEWYVKYDTIHYRDVFPEPGAKDVRDATAVFVRRYLTRGEIKQLIRDQVQGWDLPALQELIKYAATAPSRARESSSTADKKRGLVATGYEVVTLYTNSGDPFLTFAPSSGLLLRIEKNLHPDKWHPVFFLVLEKDSQQPLGKSQVELLFGRQEFQDLMHNGAMKLWYRNINPPLIGYGAINAIPNLSPGKYTAISNPNAKIEAFEVNTQTLMQYPMIAQANMGSMVNLVGSADQQMAVQAGSGMSATPQGVEAQQAMVDITTNNYQKAIESFFSRYCSYALTVFFHEMRGVKEVTPNAESRQLLINAGVPIEDFDTTSGSLKMDFSSLATPYFVRCVPGSLVELEDEKQLRLLNQMFIPLSQAMPALAHVQDQQVLQNAAATMQYIIERQIELSGSNRSHDLKTLLTSGRTPELNEFQAKAHELEQGLGEVVEASLEGQEQLALTVAELREQISLLTQSQAELFNKLGMSNGTSGEQMNNPDEAAMPPLQEDVMVERARA